MHLGRPLSVLVVAWCAVVAGAAEEKLWLDDFNAALDRAEKENKDLLLNFTGSDWCSWCKKLKEEVFDQEVFKKQAPAQFVLVEVDFPRHKPVKAGNDILMREFSVQGFPTIFLADSKGRVYGRTGYREGGAEKYLAHFAALRKVKVARDELLAQAAHASGVEKAKLLDQALAPFEGDGLLIGYDEEVNQILKADAENKAGLKNKYEIRRRILDVENAMLGARDFKGAIAKVDALLKDLNPPQDARQYALYLKARAQHFAGDPAAAMVTLQAALDVSPESATGQQIAQVLAGLKEKAATKDQPPPPEKDQ